MHKNLLLVIICSVVFCQACDKKEILQGKREEISGITISGQITNSKKLQGLPITVKSASVLKEEVEIFGNKQHLANNNKLPTKFSKLWKVNVGGGKFYSNIIALDSFIYCINSSGDICCIDQNTGKILWKKNIAKQPDGAVFSGGLTAEGKVLYIGTNTCFVTAFDTQTQKEIWKKNIEISVKGTPFYVDGKIFINTIDNQTFALDSSSGNIIWSKSFTQEETIMAVSSSPAAIGNRLICTYTSGDVFSFDQKDGHEHWNDVLFSGNISQSGFVLSHVATSPVIFDDKVLVSNSESKTILLDLISGIRLWENDFGTTSTPVVQSGWIFMLTSSNELVCINAKDAGIKWSAKITQNLDKKEYANVKWSGPVLVNNELFIFSSKGDILSYNISNGEPISLDKKLLKNLEISQAPVIVNNKMFITTNNSEILAIG